MSKVCGNCRYGTTTSILYAGVKQCRKGRHNSYGELGLCDLYNHIGILRILFILLCRAIRRVYMWIW